MIRATVFISVVAAGNAGCCKQEQDVIFVQLLLDCCTMLCCARTSSNAETWLWHVRRLLLPLIQPRRQLCSAACMRSCFSAPGSHLTTDLLYCLHTINTPAALKNLASLTPSGMSALTRRQSLGWLRQCAARAQLMLLSGLAPAGQLQAGQRFDQVKQL